MKQYLVLFYFMFFCLLVKGQSIKSIDFVGLKKTNKELLYRFLESEVGAEYDSNTVSRDVQELLNVGYFVAVQPIFDENEEGLKLIFKCEEAISLLPTLLGGGKGNNYFVKAGIRNLNLWGRGGIMKLAYQYQDGHSYFFKSIIPYIKKSNFGLNFDLKSFTSIEPIYKNNQEMVYDYLNRSIWLGGFYEFKMFHRLHLIGILQNEEFTIQEQYVDELDENFLGEEINNGTGWRVLYEYAELDFFGSIIEGFKSKSFLQTLYLENTSNPYYHFVSQWVKYKRVTTSAELAFRFKLGLTSNNFGYFAPFTLDSYLNIRGVGNKVDRGTGQMVLNAEYRKVIKSTSFGCYQLVGFVDFGSWRHPGGKLSDFVHGSNMQVYQGIGGRVYIKKLSNLVLRVDFGFDAATPSQNGFVYGFDQYF